MKCILMILSSIAIPLQSTWITSSKFFTDLQQKIGKFPWRKLISASLNLKLLGKIVNKDGVLPDPTMIADMINFPEPRNAKHVLSFLGLCGVYRDFIPDWGIITEPLYKFTHKDNELTMGCNSSSCFLKLKQL